MMTGFIDNIEELTINNSNFRKVLFTGPKSQLVVMNLKPGENIGMEVHPNVDQFIRIESGEGKAILNGEETDIKDDFAVVIPAGTEHDIVNTSNEEEMKLYTIYSPPEHPPETIHPTKADAMKAEKDYHHE